MSTAVENEIKTYTIIARGRNQKLIRQPLLNIVTATGSMMQVQPSVNYDFTPNGTLTIREGQDVLKDGPLDPETRQPTEQDALSWMTKGYQYPDGSHGPHPDFNRRFWIQGLEPGRPLPTDEDFNRQVNAGIAALDPEPVKALLAQERETHNRPVLIANAEDALKTILAMQESMKAGSGS